MPTLAQKNRQAFEVLNQALIDSVKANPQTAKIRYTGEFERFLESAESAVYETNKFIKYTVPYTPYIDAGQPPYKARFAEIYDWVGARKYGIAFESEKERKSIAWAIITNHKKRGSFKFRSSGARTQIVSKAIRESLPIFEEALTIAQAEAVNSEVLKEIRRINELSNGN